MTCCNTSGFLTQDQLRLISTNHSVIFEEICLIQQALLSFVRCQNAETNVLTIGGSTPMTAYSRITGLNLVNGGSGYENVVPVVSVTHISGIDGEVTLTFDNMGSVATATITNPGSGYTLDEVPLVVITHPIGNGAIITLTSDGDQLTDVVITQPGIDYVTLYPTMSIIGTGGTGATGTFEVDELNSYSITNVQLTNGGYGYPSNTVVSIVPAAPGVGSGAIITATVYTNTFGTNPQLYYNQVTGVIDNVMIQGQLDAVISHFTNLGYSIVPIVNPDTMNTIMWQVAF